MALPSSIVLLREEVGHFVLPPLRRTYAIVPAALGEESLVRCAGALAAKSDFSSGAFATALAAKLLERRKLDAAKAGAEGPPSEPPKAAGLIGVPTPCGAAEEKARLLAAL